MQSVLKHIFIDSEGYLALSGDTPPDVEKYVIENANILAKMFIWGCWDCENLFYFGTYRCNSRINGTDSIISISRLKKCIRGIDFDEIMANEDVYLTRKE